MIMPDSYFRKFWSTLLIFLLLYTATLMPYKLALIDDDLDGPWFYVDTIIDFLFLTDIYINFNSPIHKQEQKLYDYNRKRVA